MTFERSTDYALIQRILTEPRCYRRMGHTAAEMATFAVHPREGFEWIIANEKGSTIAVFLLIFGIEVHFCFVPSEWGRTESTARQFLSWVWDNTQSTRLVGPVPRHNRLALRLAQRVGFREYDRAAGLLLTEIRKP